MPAFESMDETTMAVNSTTSADPAAVFTHENNPYVGPRSLLEGEPLFGREQEVLELLDTTIADRIVLVHSPSGAGKTSLLQAGLIPRLRGKGFRLPPEPIRLNQTPPAGSDANRYLFSLLASLDKTLPDDRLVELASPQSPDLLAYFRERFDQLDSTEPSRQELWVFDQFEEILTLDPSDREAKEFFFNEIGKLLRDEKRLWAIFAIREDYLGELSPLAARLPTRLSNLYRLTLLEPENAADAIIGPASKRGVVFDEDAAQQLVDNLRRVRDAAFDGSTTLGPVVEPVQLQVVCLWLWDKLVDMSEKSTNIDRVTLANVNQLGDVVDDALSGYYSRRLTEVVRKTASAFAVPEQSERKIREWFSYRLISNQTRQPIPKPQNDLPEVAIAELRNAYLIREDRRGSFAWIELAHDRLIVPVTRSNDAWFNQRLSPTEIRIALWNSKGRPENLLLSGLDLSIAERWADTHPDDLTDEGRDLLSRSKKRLKGEEALTYRLLKHLRWYGLGLGAGFAVGCVILASLLWISNQQAQDLVAKTRELSANQSMLETLNTQSTESAFRARLGQISSRSLLLESEQPDLALLLGVEAVRRITDRDRLSGTAQASSRSRVFAFNALLSSLQNIPEVTTYFSSGEKSQDTIKAIAIRPDGKQAVIVNRLGNTVIIDLDQRRTISTRPGAGHHHLIGPVCVAYSPTGKSLAASQSIDNKSWTIHVTDAATGSSRAKFQAEGVVNSLAFTGGDDEVLYSAGNQVVRGTIADGKTEVVAQTEGVINDFALSSDGRRFVTADARKHVQHWDLASRKEVAGASLDVSQDLKDPPGISLEISTVAYGSHENPLLAIGVGVSITSKDDTDKTGSHDRNKYANKIFLYDLTTCKRIGLPFIGHLAPVTGLAFVANGTTLLSSGMDGSIFVWDFHEGLEAARQNARIAAANRQGQSPTNDVVNGYQLVRQLDGHRGPVQDLSVASNGHTFVSAGIEKQWILWDLDKTQRLARPVPNYEVDEGWPLNVAVSPNGNELVTGRDGADGRITFCNLQTNQWSERDPIQPKASGVANLGYSPDGQIFYVGDQDSKGTTRFWRTSDWSKFSFELPTGQVNKNLIFSHDHRLLVSLIDKGDTREAIIRSWDPETNVVAIKAIIPALSSGTWTTMAFSPDDSILAIGDSMGEVCLFHRRETAPFSKSQRNLGAVRCLAFGAKGRTLISGGDDHSVSFWHLGDPESQFSPQSIHRGPVICMAVDQAGQRLATAGDGGNLVLWDIPTGLPLGPAFVVPGGITSLAFLPDGKRLFTGGRDGILLSWDTDPDSWIKKACAIANRDLTKPEWSDNFEDEPYRPTCPDAPVPNPGK